MARRKRRKYYKNGDKGILHQTKLMFTSKARRAGLIGGLLLSPLVFAYTKFGKHYSIWAVEQAQKLGGKK